jgi:Txe/YoeB family toxin of toxin-antitoxin system
MKRTAECLEKLDRLNKTIRHEEADRVPVSDFFWGSFTRRWKKDLDLPENADPYKYYDLDMIVTTPNMDPHIKNFEVLREDPFASPPGFEKLVGDLAGASSRRINIQHRLVYQVLSESRTIKVLRMWSHYE